MLLLSITPFGELGGVAKAAKKTGSPPFAEAPELPEHFSQIFEGIDWTHQGTREGGGGGVERGFAGNMFCVFTKASVLHNVRQEEGTL